MDNSNALSVSKLENAFQQLTAQLPNQDWRSAVLIADENGSGWLEGESLLDQLNFPLHLVPAEYGGYWGQMEQLMDLYRSIYRRDPSLGLGYAGCSFIACTNVWSKGSEKQKSQVAELLKNNKKIACSYYEAKHGNDLSAVEFRAERDNHSLILNGYKEVSGNIAQSDAAVVLARTSEQLGSRSHSPLLLFKNQLPADAFQNLKRHKSTGMRGLQLGGFKLEQVRVEESTILGDPGQGLETAMTAFQLTRTLIPGMFAGALDSALRLAIGFSQERVLHGKPLSHFSNTRYELSMTYLDSLLIDSVCRLGARALQVLPEMGCLYAPAIKVIVPQLLLAAMDRLATLLGSSFYRREGQFGLFQKLLRDSKPSGFAHAGKPVCLLTLLPLLHIMAKRKNVRSCPEALVDLNTPLPPLDFSRLSLSPNTLDPVLALIDQPSLPLDAQLSSILVEAKKDLLTTLKNLHPKDMTAVAAKQTYQLSHRYAVLLTAATCLAWHKSEQTIMDATMTQWLIKRLLIQANMLAKDDAWTNAEIDQIHQKMKTVFETQKSFDLIQHTLTGWEKL